MAPHWDWNIGMTFRSDWVAAARAEYVTDASGKQGSVGAAVKWRFLGSGNNGATLGLEYRHDIQIGLGCGSTRRICHGRVRETRICGGCRKMEIPGFRE